MDSGPFHLKFRRDKEVDDLRILTSKHVSTIFNKSQVLNSWSDPTRLILTLVIRVAVPTLYIRVFSPMHFFLKICAGTKNTAHHSV